MDKLIRSKVLIALSGAYLVLLVACVCALFVVPVFATFMEGERMESGCFVTEAFLAGASCHGFVGSAIVALLLQLPFVLVAGPLAGLGALASGEVQGVIYGVPMLGVSVALWAPLVYLWSATRPATQASVLADRRRPPDSGRS